MAATGKTPILLYGSTTPTNVPVAGNLTNSSDGCEIAINVADKNLFFKDATNAVNTVPIRQSSASSNGWLSFTDWNTFNSKASTTSPTFSGNVTLSTGNLVIGTSGKGIDFSATAGTGTSELLADYEEGTWTPTIIGTTTAGTASYATRKGRYTKVGRLVTIDVYVNWNSGTGTGNLALSGLPYTAANDGTYASICLSSYGNLTLTAGNFMLGYVNVNSSTVYFEQRATGTGTNTSVAYDASAYIIFSCTYTV